MLYILSLDKCLMTCVHHYGSIQCTFIALNSSVLHYFTPLPTPTLAATILFTVSIALPFSECDGVGTTYRTAFSNCLLSLSSIHSGSLQVFSWLHSSLLVSADSHPIMQMYQLNRSPVCAFSRIWLFCDLVDCSPPGSSVHGIYQARILEWVAISFSRGSSWLRDRTWVSCITGRFFTAQPLDEPRPFTYWRTSLWLPPFGS